MPGQPLLVKFDDRLCALGVGLSCGHQVRLVRPLPLDQEHQFPGRVGRSDDPLSLEVAFESLRLVLIRLSLLFRLLRGRGVGRLVLGALLLLRGLLAAASLLVFQLPFKLFNEILTVDILNRCSPSTSRSTRPCQTWWSACQQSSRRSIPPPPRRCRSPDRVLWPSWKAAAGRARRDVGGLTRLNF